MLTVRDLGLQSSTETKDQINGIKSEVKTTGTEKERSIP